MGYTATGLVTNTSIHSHALCVRSSYSMSCWETNDDGNFGLNFIPDPSGNLKVIKQMPFNLDTFFKPNFSSIDNKK